MIPETPKRPDARSRGSVLVLATVVVVLLAMLGAGFVQMSRLDRVATNQMDNRSQDYEGSILRFIGGILAGDVRDPDSDEYLTNDMEKYDFPWTNGNVQELVIDKWLRGYDIVELPNYVPSVYPRIDLNGETFVDGGSFDDAWLAAIEPDFTGTYADGTPAAGPYWPHLTNLTGVHLDLLDTYDPDRDGDGNPDGIQTPRMYAATADRNPQTGNTEILFADMAANPGLFADADGDGIPDARWTWAPLPEQFGLTYVMAVRIIDNSALADINTWAVQSDGTGAYPTAAEEAVRWYWPGDLDLRATVQQNTFATPADGAAVLDDLTNAQRNMAYYLTADRTEYRTLYRNWLRSSRLYDRPADGPLDDYALIGSQLEKDQNPATPGVNAFREDMAGGTTFPRFARRNEAELRWRHGLNRSSDNLTADPPVEIEDAAPSVFWRQANIETDFTDIPASEQQHFENNPRLRMTIYSGSSDRGKANLNFSGGDEISELLRENMDDYPRVVNLGVWPNVQFFGDQAAAAIIDFRDTDSPAAPPAGIVGELTRVGDFYGMEYLPFVSEVYLQGRYEAAVTPAAPPGAPNDVVTWTHTPGDYAAVIELVNPWPWPIRLPNVQVVVEELATGEEEVWGELEALTGGLTVLEGHQMIALKVEDGGGDNSELPSDSATYRVFPVTAPDWPVGGTAADIANDSVNIFAPNARVSVHLRALDNDGDRVQYQSFKSVAIPPTVEYEYTPGTPSETTGDDGYFQHFALGTADGLSALTVRRQDVDPDYKRAAPDGNRLSPANDLQIVELNAPQAPGTDSQLSTSQKGAQSPAADAAAGNREDLDDRVEDSIAVGGAPASGDEPFVIGNAGVIYRAGDLARVVLLGPTTAQTVAEVWTDSVIRVASVPSTPADWEFRIGNFMINPLETFIGVTGVPAYPDNLYEQRVTYGTELLDRVTTLGPGVDGLDNDGDSRIDDEDEQLIPGRLNLNTASRDTLARSLPLEPAASDFLSLPAGPKRSLIELILTLRADPDVNAPRTLSNRQADHPGIAWIGELLESAAGGAASLIADGTTFAGPGGLIEDFNEYEQGVPSALDTVGVGPGDDDEFSNDREQFLTMLANLNQVASVRSDVFTAYVLVRGYPSSDFSNGGTNDPVEEYRIIATFDRSVIHEARPLPKLRSVTVYRQN
ncbi:MAG: hypothetical protein AAF710_05960 [Planctomycetota bacterium]